MKKYLFTLFFLFAIVVASSGQTTDKLVSNCINNAGPNTRYLKDFRVQLGQALSQTDLRFKANMSLWKNTKYRFTLCISDDSKGQMILSIKDDANKIVLSSFDQKSGKTYTYVDFNCSKSGIYQLNYDFINGQQGSGVGVVSMIK